MYMYIYIYTICYTSYNLVYTPINYSYIYHILSFLWELYIYIYMRLAMNRIHHLQRRDFWISPRTDLFGHVASPDCSRDIDLMLSG